MTERSYADLYIAVVHIDVPLQPMLEYICRPQNPIVTHYERTEIAMQIMSVGMCIT